MRGSGNCFGGAFFRWLEGDLSASGLFVVNDIKELALSLASDDDLDFFFRSKIRGFAEESFCVEKVIEKWNQILNLIGFGSVK